MSPAISISLLTVVLLSASALSGTQGQSPQPAECVTVETQTRLQNGQSFVAPVGRGLEFRLTADSGDSWWVSVEPSGTRDDYLSVVSPPFRTAPHLMIGSGYNLTAAQSAQISPRLLRFVTSAEEFKQARQLAARATRDPASDIAAADIERLGKGSLEVSIADFAISQGADALAWIRVRARACQPRHSGAG
jgi:hypothetical protein